MRFHRPRSLNGLILVGFGLVALPLLLAVIWALVSLDRLTEQSEQLVFTGVAAAENNRLLVEQLGTLERVARQHQVLRNPDSLQLLEQDLERLEVHLDAMAELTELAGASALARSIGSNARDIVATLATADVGQEDDRAAIEAFAPLRNGVMQLTEILSAYVDDELRRLQDAMRNAQRVSAWQVAALVPGTLVLVLVFTLLVARPIRRIDAAISQLGGGGFSKSIEIKGPTDLERLGRQLEWLRIRLLELAKEKNRFLRHMSHELKTPLANIREGTDILLDGTVGELDGSQREVADILRANGIKLQRLIENLLSFSAWQSKSEVLTLTDFPLGELVDSVVKAQRLALKAAGIGVEIDIDHTIVNADRDKLKTVLDNLLSNAIKFTPMSGKIAIRGKRTPTSVVIEFGDSGPGIPAAERSRIFDAFFQGGVEQGGPVGGTGIGLSVVLECVQAHGGTIDLVESDEFPGALFRIELPQKHRAVQMRRAANA